MTSHPAKVYHPAMGLETWQILKDQAEKFLDWSRSLKGAKRAEGAFYLAHMGVELIMKSAIAKENQGWHPSDTDSHHLMRLISDKRTQFLFLAMAEDQNSNVHAQFIKATSSNQAWLMQYRYEGSKLTESQMIQSIDLYEEIFRWTSQNYV